MNLTPLFKLSLISGALMLAACGGDDNSSSSNNMDDEHDHTASARILMTSNSDTALTVFDQAHEEFEDLEDAALASAGRVIRSDDGLSAAVVTATGVQFVYSGIHPESEEAEAESGEHSETHEAELLSDLTLTGAGLQVSMTQNHFAVLKDGDTHLYPADSLEEATGAEESVALTGVTQSYPAAILDEEHGLTLVFADGKATVYEEETATEASVACASPAAVAHVGELTLAQCDNGLISVVVEEEDGSEPVIEAEVVKLGNLAVTALMTNGHEGFILGEGTQIKTLSWNHDTESLDSADVALETSADGICAVEFATAVEVAGILTSDGQLHFTDLEENVTDGRVVLDDSNATATCSDWLLTAGSEAFAVVDSDVDLMYYVDSHEGSEFHIHETFDLPADSDIRSAALLHETGTAAAHDH